MPFLPPNQQRQSTEGSVPSARNLLWPLLTSAVDTAIWLAAHTIAACYSEARKPETDVRRERRGRRFVERVPSTQ